MSLIRKNNFLHRIESQDKLRLGNLSEAVELDEAVTKRQLNAVKPYRVYTALITWDGTTVSAVELENTLGAVTFTHEIEDGSITATATGKFTENKTWVSVTPSALASHFNAGWWDVNRVWIMHSDALGSGTDPVAETFSFEIRVYN